MSTPEPPLYIRMLACLISIAGYATSLLSVLIVQIFPTCKTDYPVYYSNQPSHHPERRLNHPVFVSPSDSKQDVNAIPGPQNAKLYSDMPVFTDPFEARRNLVAFPVRSVTLPQFIPRCPSPQIVKAAPRAVIIPDIVVRIPEEGSSGIDELPQSTARVSSGAQTLHGTKNPLHIVFYKRW